MLENDSYGSNDSYFLSINIKRFFSVLGDSRSNVIAALSALTLIVNKKYEICIPRLKTSGLELNLIQSLQVGTKT